MSNRIIAIGINNPDNIIFETIEEARKGFLINPANDRTMTYTTLQRVLRTGELVYDRDSKKPFCLDFLEEKNE